MIKSGIDQDALIDMFAEASAKQGDKLRKAVADATLKALQGRELTLDNVRKVIKSVTQATSAGAAKNPASAVDVEAMLRKAFDGMDAALLQGGARPTARRCSSWWTRAPACAKTQLKAALDGVEKMEDMFFKTVGKAVQGVGTPLQGPWDQVLKTMKLEGTATGAGAAQTVEQLMAQAQDALRKGRATSLRAIAGADGQLQRHGQRRAHRHERCAGGGTAAAGQGRSGSSGRQGSARAKARTTRAK